MFLVCIVMLRCHKTGWDLLSMSQEKVFLFISAFLLKIAISSCHFRGKTPNPSVWFHLYIAKYCHSGTSKPGHEVNVWIALYWNSKWIATDAGAEKERLFMFSSLPNVLTASKTGPSYSSSEVVAGREGKRLSVWARGQVRMSIFFPQ